jgi:hypothetical protein
VRSEESGLPVGTFDPAFDALVQVVESKRLQARRVFLELHGDRV